MFQKRTVLSLLVCLAITPAYSQNKPAARKAAPPIPTYIDGGWINVDYVEGLSKNRSVVNSMKGDGFTAVEVNRSKSTNKVSAVLSWGFHEGINVDVAPTFQKQRYKLYNVDDTKNVYNEMRYLKAGDFERLLIYDNTGNTRDTLAFQKISKGGGSREQTSRNLAAKVEELIMEKIIAGTYELDGKNVKFSKDGTITGWNKSKRYSMRYETGFNNIDIMKVGDVSYTYDFSNDGNTLNLYSVIDPNEHDAKKGKLKYSLKKSQPAVGGGRDEHGCLPSAGYSWSQLRNECIRWWENARPLEGLAGPSAVAWLLFSSDKKKAEVSMPGVQGTTILTEKGKGTYVNGAFTLTTGNGYVLKKNGKVIYKSKD